VADLVTTQAIPQAGARLRRYTAAASVVAGNVLYRDLTSTYPGGVTLADANAADPAKARAVGIAVNAAVAGAPVDAIWDGDVDLGVAAAKGTVFALSATPGKIAPVADLVTGYYTTVLGVGKGGNILKVRIFPSEQLIP
jgi:hypothetical protein